MKMRTSSGDTCLADITKYGEPMLYCNGETNLIKKLDI